MTGNLSIRSCGGVPAVLRSIGGVVVCMFCLMFADLASGADCQTYQWAYKLLKEKSLFPLPSSSQWHAQVWEGFFNRMDREQLYLKQQDFTHLLQEFQDIAVDGDGAVCQHLERAAKIVVDHAAQAYSLYPDLLSELESRGYKTEDGSYIVIPIERGERHEKLSDFVNKWKNYLVYKRRESFHLSDDEFSRDFADFVGYRKKELEHSFYQYWSFIEALYAAVGSYSLFRPNNKSVQSSSFMMSEGVGPWEAVREGSLYLKFLLSSYVSVPPYYKNHIKVAHAHPRRVRSGFSSYYDISRGDIWVNLWLGKTLEFDRHLVLRREKTGYRWDHYSHVLRRPRHSYQHIAMHRLFVTTVVEGRNEINTSSSSSESKPELVRKSAQLKTPPVRPQSSRGKVTVMYLSLQRFNNAKSETEDKFNDDMNEVMGEFERSSFGANHRAILLDLRNSSRNLSLEKYLLLMNFFLPHKIVGVVQKQQHSQVYKSKKSAASYSGPLVVLVNKNTQQYSELMAAVFQEYGRALILGSGLGKRTSGLTHISEGYNDALQSSSSIFHHYRITSGFLRTPLGKALLGQGLKPDITLPQERDVFDGSSSYSVFAIPPPSAELEAVAQEGCYSTLPPAFITLLKKRSDQRLLGRTYMRQLNQRGSRHPNVQRSLSFQEAFGITAEQLRAEERTPSCKPQCMRLSLSLQDFLQDRRASEARNVIYQKEPLLKRSHIIEAARDDVAVREALSVTADYSYYAGSFGLEK